MDTNDNAVLHIIGMLYTPLMTYALYKLPSGEPATGNNATPQQEPPAEQRDSANDDGGAPDKLDVNIVDRRRLLSVEVCDSLSPSENRHKQTQIQRSES